MAGGGGGSNTTHALLSPDPETLPMGEVSRLATGEVLGTKQHQRQLTVAPNAPSAAGPNSSLSQRNGPAILTQELVAENGLFQPKLKLTQKSPKLTPRPDPPEVGTRQLTLCPWGHDAKITKIGVIPTRGSPGQGKANGSQDRRQDLGRFSECTTWI